MSLKIENTLNEIAAAGGLNTAKPASFTATATFTGAVDLSGSSNVKMPASPLSSKTLTSTTGAAPSLTATGLVGGLYANQSFGAGAATLPLGTTLSSVLTGAVTGSSFEAWFFNTSTGAASTATATITGATGMTVVGTTTVTAGKNAIIRFYCSATNTWSAYTDVSA